jgi:arsenate reductase
MVRSGLFLAATTHLKNCGGEMKKRVLILCTGNSCRSQMAEGILRHYGSDRFEVESAGTQPAPVHPVTIQVMQELGIDISQQRSKHVDHFEGQPFDYIITVCNSAREACPFFPGTAKRIHWEFPDPPHAQRISPSVIEEFRNVRDMIHLKFKAAAEKGFEAVR